MCSALNGNPAAQVANAMNRVSNHPAALQGETRWQFLKRQLLAAPAVDPIKQLNLV